MALTPPRALPADSSQIDSGLSAPSGPPADPTDQALYYQLSAGGAITGLFFWNPTFQEWTPMPVPSASNWSEGMECGWSGPHNIDHWQRIPEVVTFTSTLIPMFSVATPSTSPIPFEIQDVATGTAVVLASGVFPANAIYANASQCSLQDPAATPVGQIVFVPSGAQPVAHYVCVPVGGHGAMPADGETFKVSFSSIY